MNLLGAFLVVVLVVSLPQESDATFGLLLAPFRWLIGLFGSTQAPTSKSIPVLLAGQANTSSDIIIPEGENVVQDTSGDKASVDQDLASLNPGNMIEVKIGSEPTVETLPIGSVFKPMITKGLVRQTTPLPSLKLHHRHKVLFPSLHHRKTTEATLVTQSASEDTTEAWQSTTPPLTTTPAVVTTTVATDGVAENLSDLFTSEEDQE